MTMTAQSAASLRLLELLYSKAPVGIGLMDHDFRLVYLNDHLAAANGSTADEQRGRLVADVVPELWPQIHELCSRVLETGQAVLNAELDTSAAPALDRSYLTSYYPVELDDQLFGVGVVVVDITGRKHADDAVRFQAQLLAAVGQAIIAVGPERTVIYWNRAAEEMFGWSAAEAIGRRSVDLIPRTETTEQTATMLAMMLRGESWSGEYDVTRRDGTTLAVHVTNTPVFDHLGQLVAVIGSSIDVTERKAGELARWRISSIVDSFGDAIFSSSTDGIITSWNLAAEELFGHTAAEAIGQNVNLIAPPERAHEQVATRRRLNAGGPPEHLETARLRKDGTLVEVLITASTTRDEAGAVVGLSVIAQDITERLAAQRGLASSQRRLAEAQRTAHLGSFELDVCTGELSWSLEFSRIFGIDPDVAPTRELVMARVHPDDVASIAAAEADAGERGLSVDLDFRIIRAESEQRWVRAHIAPEFGNDGSVLRIAGTMLDDTDRVEADRVRRAAETRFEIGFEQSAIGAAITDLRGTPRRVNQAMCTILGRPADFIVDRAWAEFGHPDDVPLAQMMLTRMAAGHDMYEDERRYLRADGSIVWVSAHLALVRDETDAPNYFFVQFQDISERKRMEHDLAHQALHDSLTGLPNRVLLGDRLVNGLARSRRRGSHLAVMFLDVDQFKVVNDSLGHGAGDAFLQLAAERISSSIRPGDTVARFGGDEFVVVCDDVSAIETDEIATRVLTALSEPCHIAGEEMRVTASLGIALSTVDSTPDALLRDSDAAMYRAKERGGDRVELFDETLHFIAQRRLATASALHRALERDEFTVHYQPIVDLVEGTMVGVEALLRWQHPEHGLIAPADFIAVAEETGLIVSIGALVLEQACRDLASWQSIARSGGCSNISVAVNISVRQMRSSRLTAMIEDVVRRSGVRPGDLCLELTESVFMEDVEYFEGTLAGLKALGVDLAVDDFGTGYSSLSYLKRFPFDAVKVDRAFVDGLGTDPHDTALVAAIVAMANALSLQITAEGVETSCQLSCLKELGVRRAQGFYLARPMPAEAIAELMARGHRWQVD